MDNYEALKNDIEKNINEMVNDFIAATGYDLKVL